jgi:NADPH:quinone reductase-like Zn-dependent oxidoreductase
MKAAIFSRYGANDVVEVRDIPVPECGPADVLIRVRAASVNPVDWKVRSGKARFMTGSRFPKVLGNECSGIVATVGSSVRTIQTGEPVIGLPGIRSLGAFAEYCRVPGSAVYPAAQGIPFEQAACLPIAGLTALQALRDKGQVTYTSKVLINGAAGGVGHFAVQIAKIFGAQVTAVCSTGNSEFVRGLGADHVIDRTRDDFTRGGARYDIIFDAVAKSSFGRCKKILAKRGIYISTLPSAAVLLNQYFTGYLFRRKAWSVWVRPNGPDLVWMENQVAAGKLKVSVDRIYRFDQVQEALAYSEAGKARGKIVLEIAP